MADPTRRDAVAIVGMAGRFPGAADLDEFWRVIRDGVEVLEPVSESDLDRARVPASLRDHPSYVKRGTFLESPELFDAAFFGLSPREAQVLDPQHRIFLECAWEALEHAGHGGGADGRVVGVYAGVSFATYVNQLLANPSFVAAVGGYQLMIGNDKDFIATRASYKLDLRGPSLTIQTACSTSLVAVVVACRALARGECDLALAGGASIYFPQRAGYLFEEGMIFSPDGHCRPFDADARGTRSGPGAGVVALKRLDDAVADRDTIHAVILGAAINNDGSGKAGFTAPSIEGQVEVIATAQALGGVDPRSITYIEAHGTGTPLGDPIEVAALTQVFRASTPDVGFCRLGALKANIGHLDAAAGVAGLIKTVLALEHRALPPLVNLRSPNPQLALETSPFSISASAAEWTTQGTPRRAGVSSFGIGGTNAHVVLEEGPSPPHRPVERPAHLLLLSAKTPAALDQATANLAAHLTAHPDQPLEDVEWTLQAGRQVFEYRRVAVVRDRDHAVRALSQPQRAPVLGGRADGAPRRVAFLFSGQGSQHVGMGANLYRCEPVYRDAIDRCAELLEPHLDLDPRRILFGPEEDGAIHETRLTQPLLFATEYALAALWQSWGVAPAAMAGHSIGEYVAAHLAGVFSLEDALALVAARGRLMQAQPPGDMAAVHLEPRELERWLGDGVEIAAINAPGLCAISGPSEAIARALEQLATSGIQSRLLHTSHAFHSAMMEPALAPFSAIVDERTLKAPSIPYVSNLTGTWIAPEQATSPAYYAQHLRRPVRFEACVRAIAADPALLLLEVGPGNALTSLARLTLGNDGGKRVVASLAHPRERRPDLDAALEAAGRLWLAGASIDWRGLHRTGAPRRVPLPTYPFERKAHWVEPLPGSPPSQLGAADRDALHRHTDVGAWMYAPTWTRDDSCATAEPNLEGTWLISAPRGPLAEELSRQVERAGARVVAVEPEADDLAAVLRGAGAVTGAIHLCGVPDMPAGAHADDVYYHAIVRLAAAFEAAAPTGRIVVATTGAHSVLDEPVTRVEAALALGPVQVLPVEVRGLQLSAVDLAVSERADAALWARQLVEEAASARPERIVARRAGRRFVRRYQHVPAAAPAPEQLPLEPDGTYLITGGLGGIGLALAQWLAARVSARLLLTSRNPSPDPAAIQAIEQAGGEVLVATADVTDEAAMRAAVASARARWGALHGVIHAAGVAGSAAAAIGKSTEDVRAVLRPKVEGLNVLVRVLGDTPLDLVVLLGSTSAVLGGIGLSDYAAANAALDAFVDSTARPAAWRRVLAIDYAAWGEVGMAARAVGMVARRHVRDAFVAGAIAPEDGTDSFARALASGRSRVVVSPIDLFQLLAAVAAQSRIATDVENDAPAAESAPPQERPAMSTDYAEPDNETERRVAAIWSELLGVERIGANDDFFELGGHSLLATRVLARIDVSFGARLALRDVFDAPTIRTLSERVLATTGATAPDADASQEREEIEF
jgi:acyl transferase domain-containing protein